MSNKKLELVCPAGTLTALKTAIDAGADTVYAGFQDQTNARNFPGLNFSREELQEGIEYAHAKNKQVYLALNTYSKAGSPTPWIQALKDAEKLQPDAVIIADVGLLDYCKQNHPKLKIHLSVQASASNSEAINFYTKEFDIKRAVLPRVLTIEEIKNLNKNINIETEVFVFGGLCVMAEGRCLLSSYITGKSPNMNGVCSPASHVHYENNFGTLKSKLGEFTINQFSTNEPAGYPTLCKGRFKAKYKGGFKANSETSYVFEEPKSLNMLSDIDKLQKAGVTALKIEGRQRGKAYIEKVVQEFSLAINNLKSSTHTRGSSLHELSEGQHETTGAYEKQWQ